MAKVFISHRSADKHLAEELAAEIRSAGHDVWLDTWAIEVGDSILGQMQAGIKDANYLVLCLAPSGVGAPWTAEEWESFRTRQLNGEAVRLLPARLSGGSPPAILAHVKYADLAHDWSQGVAALLKAIR